MKLFSRNQIENKVRMVISQVFIIGASWSHSTEASPLLDRAYGGEFTSFYENLQKQDEVHLKGEWLLFEKILTPNKENSVTNVHWNLNNLISLPNTLPFNFTSRYLTLALKIPFLPQGLSLALEIPCQRIPFDLYIVPQSTETLPRALLSCGKAAANASEEIVWPRNNLKNRFRTEVSGAYLVLMFTSNHNLNLDAKLTPPIIGYHERLSYWWSLPLFSFSIFLFFIYYLKPSPIQSYSAILAFSAVAMHIAGITRFLLPLGHKLILSIDFLTPILQCSSVYLLYASSYGFKRFYPFLVVLALNLLVFSLISPPEYYSNKLFFDVSPGLMLISYGSALIDKIPKITYLTFSIFGIVALVTTLGIIVGLHQTSLAFCLMLCAYLAVTKISDDEKIS